ncbi:hypothetical protein EJD97_001300 [Solanum chilense]|uniref:Uncharacterized protein n=1 Tax=Solanum chilense TaxID=4083 RepID=A0A6N2APA6_SOLCI|nr:hypothetical protein EJD97_001300 [Solanum chilense]
MRSDTRKNFPENCGPFVRENNITRKVYPEFPSNTKLVKVDFRKSSPENCVSQKKKGSDTQCSVDGESKSFSEDMADPSNFEATSSHGGSSHLNTSCRPTNGNQPLKLKEENLICDESTQQHEVLDWDQYEYVVMKKQMDLGVSQQDLRNSAVICDVSCHGLTTEYEHIDKVKEVRETLKRFDDVYTKLLREYKSRET